MPKPCKPRVVLLDFDGTIVDTMEAYAQGAARILGEHGIPREKVLEAYRKTAGMAFRDQLRLMGVEEALIEDVARRFEDYKKSILAQVRLDGGVVRFIKGARSLGLLVYLSTNNECNVVAANTGLIRVFDGVLCHDPVRGLRKGRDHVEELKRLLGVRECEILFIGDSDYDIDLYKRLGVHVLKTRGLWLDGGELLERIRALL